MTDAAKIALGDASFDYPVLSGTVGPDVVDIRKFYGQTDAFTYDPGFTSTASCQSKITYIDGDKGVLLHRGYAIGELAEQSSFMEVCYLLLNGELPSAGGADCVQLDDHAPHDGARTARDLLPRIPSRRASNGYHVRCRRRAQRLLP